MEILWCAKAPRADIYSQFVSALRTAAGCVKRRSRRAGPVCPAAKYALLPAGHAGPALQGAAVAWGGQGCSPLRTLSLRASPRREASALGVQTGAAIRFSDARPLDKPAGMGIIINRRGRCDKRSAPQQLNDYFELFSSQKPSPCRVAVSAFQSLDSYRDRMTQNMNRKHEKHTVTPLQKEVTDRLAMYTASWGCIISRSPVFVNSHRLTNPAGWV